MQGRQGISQRRGKSFLCYPGPSGILSPEEMRSRGFWRCFKELPGCSKSRLLERCGEEEIDLDIRRLLCPLAGAHSLCSMLYPWRYHRCCHWNQRHLFHRCRNLLVPLLRRAEQRASKHRCLEYGLQTPILAVQKGRQELLVKM